SADIGERRAPLIVARHWRAPMPSVPMTTNITTGAESVAVQDEPGVPTTDQHPTRVPKQWFARVFRTPVSTSRDVPPDEKEAVEADPLLAFGAEGEQPPVAPFSQERASNGQRKPHLP